LHLNRNSIGYEINQDFKPIIQNKLACNQASMFFDESHISFEEDHQNSFSFDSLPYLFTDPLKMDKKVDVKKIQFGSRIDKTESKRDELYGVKKVISPERIELSNGLIVSLLGVKSIPEYDKQAMNYLEKKFNKRRVYLRYDRTKYDDGNNLLCYVYLDNKTFINNHLIRTGFVRVNTEMDYMYKSKFLASYPN